MALYELTPEQVQDIVDSLEDRIESLSNNNDDSNYFAMTINDLEELRKFLTGGV